MPMTHSWWFSPAAALVIIGFGMLPYAMSYYSRHTPPPFTQLREKDGVEVPRSGLPGWVPYTSLLIVLCLGGGVLVLGATFR